jgi:hypothetical protein
MKWSSENSDICESGVGMQEMQSSREGSEIDRKS